MKLKKEQLNKFINSYRFASFLTMKAKAIHKEFRIADAEVVIERNPDPGFVAYTDNVRYHLNLGNRAFFEGLDDEGVVSLSCGVLLHEIGHRLFSCFTASSIWQTSIRAARFYPEDPKVSGKEYEYLLEIKDMLEDKKLAATLATTVGCQLYNVLEDGRIEELCLDFCGNHHTLYSGLILARSRQFKNSVAFEECNELFRTDDPMKRLSAIISLMLFYARFTDVKDLPEDGEDTDLYRCFEKITPCIDEYLNARSQVELCNAMNIILISIWPYIRDLFKDDEKKEGENTSPSPEPEDKEEKTSEESGSSEETMGGDSSSCLGASKSPGLTISKEALEKLESVFSGLPSTGFDLPGRGTDDSKMSSLLDQRMPIMRNDVITTDGSGELIYAEQERDSQTELDVRTVLRKIGEEQRDDEKEELLKKSIEDFEGNIDFPSIHKGVDCKIVREKVSEKDRIDYLSISKPLRKIAEQIARKSTFLEEETASYELRNRYSGTSLNPASFAREDYKIFKKDVEIDPETSLSVAVLIDESGSMRGYSRSEAAKRAAILLYEYCDIMKIPVCMYGHSTEGRYVTLYAYADFEKKDPADRYRLMKIDARSENRDGFALRFLKERIKKEDSLEKILIVISDGQPADSGYFGSAAYKDLSEITKECENEGIFLIAAAIGNDKPTIKGIYGERHFLDISDLDTLPITLTKLIKAHIKK